MPGLWDGVSVSWGWAGTSESGVRQKCLAAAGNAPCVHGGTASLAFCRFKGNSGQETGKQVALREIHFVLGSISLHKCICTWLSSGTVNLSGESSKLRSKDRCHPTYSKTSPEPEAAWKHRLPREPTTVPTQPTSSWAQLLLSLPGRAALNSFTLHLHW